MHWKAHKTILPQGTSRLLWINNENILKACYVLYKWTYVKHMPLKIRWKAKQLVNQKPVTERDPCSSLIWRESLFPWVEMGANHSDLSRNWSTHLGKDTLILADQPTFADDLMSKVNLVTLTSFRLWCVTIKMLFLWSKILYTARERCFLCSFLPFFASIAMLNSYVHPRTAKL